MSDTIPIMDSNLESLIPQHKHDEERVLALAARGYPAIAPILPKVFEWTEDGNWPVAGALMGFFASLGAVVAPEVRRVINSGDVDWLYFVLCGIVSGTPELISELEPELTRIAQSPTPNEKFVELDEVARSILKERE